MGAFWIAISIRMLVIVCGMSSLVENRLFLEEQEVHVLSQKTSVMPSKTL